MACSKSETPHLSVFLKHWTAIHAHAGSHSRLGFLASFGEAVLCATGVRWHLEFEKTAQLARIGIEKAVEHAQQCKTRQWSLKSSSKLVGKVKADPFFIGYVMVEAAAVACHLKPFVQLTYNSEGECDGLQMVLEKDFRKLKTRICLKLEENRQHRV